MCVQIDCIKTKTYYIKLHFKFGVKKCQLKFWRGRCAPIPRQGNQFASSALHHSLSSVLQQLFSVKCIKMYSQFITKRYSFK